MALMTYSNPTTIARIFDDLFDADFDMMDRSLTRGSFPRVDIIEEKDSYVIKADIPGMDKENLTVSVKDGMLSIVGEKKQEVEKKEKDRYYHFERSYGRFERSFNLPDNVDSEHSIFHTYR